MMIAYAWRICVDSESDTYICTLQAYVCVAVNISYNVLLLVSYMLSDAESSKLVVLSRGKMGATDRAEAEAAAGEAEAAGAAGRGDTRDADAAANGEKCCRETGEWMLDRCGETDGR